MQCAPMHWDEPLRAEALVDIERAVGIDVDAAILEMALHPVVPDRHHPADRQERGVDREALADVVEHLVIGEVDVACVVDLYACAADDVADALGSLGLAPAAVVVAGRDGFDLEAADLELIARGQLADL